MHQPTPPFAAPDTSAAGGRTTLPSLAVSLAHARSRGSGQGQNLGPPTARTRPGAPLSSAWPGTKGVTPRSAPSATFRRSGELPPAHKTMIGVALPGLVISTEHGQLTGLGLEGFYRAGRRLLSRCRLRVAGREPLPSQARMTDAHRARFVGTLRTSSAPGPDPDVMVERTRDADGTERITLRSWSPHPLRLPVEVDLGTDLADLGSIAAGRAGPALSASVHASGLRWSGAGGGASVTAVPPPADALASAGLLRWEFLLPPGGSTSLELRVRPDGVGPLRAVGRTAADPLASAHATGDDPAVPALLRTSIEDLRALLLRDPAHPADVHLAAGVPWRCGLAPAEALAAARMTLPLGTRLAAGTLRALARTQHRGPGPRYGMIPGPRRDTGPHLPPGCTGTEATLLFPVLLAEARRWGLCEHETQELMPAAERCLAWLRTTAGDGTYVPDPHPGGPVRCDTQARAHRAALLGAELLDDFGRPGGDGLRQFAGRLRTSFQRDFWIDDPAGGRPAAARAPDGRLVPHLSSAAAHLLDTGLLGGGAPAPGLLDPVQTDRLARLLGSPAMDSGWGLRGLAEKEAGYNPFGHRAGAVRVQETAIAVAGLAAAGHEKEAGSLLRGVVAAAGTFGHRLPEMYAGEQRTDAGAPLPHPAACRPAATAAAAGVLLLTTLAGIRPDAPAKTVTLRPVRDAPLGELGLTGLRVAGAPFSIRVSRLGLAMVEEAAAGLQLGA
ncbi:glycogen debranching N-terminal domain-containing protein [Streptomyces sp. NPDC097107]|uniref:glycogen debranching N-terminal domain-containing protein n=1 Tax=Streptomyces sp. NPDC097107 TaxID=3366089 RepID=UPI0037F2113B